ncbi:GFA family protein [Bradyrhizobium sp. LHD-71]|uniref:GFA family protein n=1 Tax=Bradyrhizobium sp. LHD-71 TaxID=3072141 RepID=UPI00280D73E9|nr:GFA family protein [Bradyrhizobium sp. LHD-71]MDQ8730368.1 GFA family protein [Bradyrhizobium sp. LHD-71]
MASATRSLTGGCQCGAVRYEWLQRPDFSSVCYCRMCQKASGQPFMGLTGGKCEHLRWIRGAPSMFKSSNVAERGFCRECGTPLTYAFAGTGNVSVTINSLDDPEAMPPTLQFGIEGKVSWMHRLHELPTETADEWLKKNGVVVQSNQHPDKTGA